MANKKEGKGLNRRSMLGHDLYSDHIFGVHSDHIFSFHNDHIFEADFKVEFNFEKQCHSYLLNFRSHFDLIFIYAFFFSYFFLIILVH